MGSIYSCFSFLPKLSQAESVKMGLPHPLLELWVKRQVPLGSLHFHSFAHTEH